MSEWGLPSVTAPIEGSVRPPGSKSVTIRALAVAAMASGRSHLYGGLHADDPAAMTGVLRGFGSVVDTSSEPWTVDGGRLMEPEDTLDAGESGLTARVAIAMAGLVDGTTIVDGRGRLRQRPMGPLVRALAEQGAEVSSEGPLPVTVTGRGRIRGGEMTVDATTSSQFVTALLLVAPLAETPTRLRVDGDRVSAGYVALTTDVMRSFGVEVSPTIIGYEIPNQGYHPADVEIEPDVSAAVYPMVAAAITGGAVTIEGVGLSWAQPDIVVAGRLTEMGCDVVEDDGGLRVEGPRGLLHPIDANMSEAPDGALALAVACLFADGPSRIRGLGTLRHKESDRLVAMSEGLNALGAASTVDGDTLVIEPGDLRGTVIDPHGDHRVAMSLALAGLRVDGVRVSDPGVVDKTWPGFWAVMTDLTRSHGER